MKHISQFFINNGTSNGHGVSSGSLLFVIRWLSITMIIFSSELLIRYGALGLVGFILIIGLALITYGFISKMIVGRFPDKDSILSIIHSKSTPTTSRFYQIMFYLLSVFLLITQVIAIHLMLSTLFTLPFAFTQLIFFIICFVYISFNANKTMQKMEPIFIIIAFMTVILIPVYNFVQKGITPVYNGIWLYHPYILYWKNESHLQFFLIVFIFLTAIIALDRVTWDRLFQIQREKIRRTTAMASFILILLLLGVSSLLLISLANKSFDFPGTILFTLIQDLQTPILQGLFLTFCLVISLSVISMELHYITKVTIQWMKKHQNQKKRSLPIQRPIVLLVYVILFYLISLYSLHSIIKIFTFYGIICIALLPTLAHLIWVPNQLRISHVFATVTSFFLGWIILWTLGEFTAIASTFIFASGCFFVIYLLQKRKSIIRK